MHDTSLRWALVSAAVVLWGAGRGGAEEAVTLRESFPAGHRYRVNVRVELSGSLTPPAEKGKPAPQPIALRGNSTIDYDERIVDATDRGEVRKTVRIYRRMDFHRTVGGRPQETALRPAVRRLVVLRHGNSEVPFSPDGPLTWGEIDQVRTDVFTPALGGLLPDRAAQPGDHWEATALAVQELTDLERIDEGKLECRLEQVSSASGKRLARVSFRGTVRGPTEDGSSRQRLEGYLLFDVDAGFLSYLYLRGTHSLLEKDGREAGRVEGRFVLSRQPRRLEELSDEALRGVTLEPNADNTRLLYDNPDLGVRFEYPRRWHVGVVRGNQVTLDGSDRSGLLLTVEPLARVPTGAQLLEESRRELERQRVRLVRIDPVRRLAGTDSLEHFGLYCEVNNQRILMDYHVTRQREGGVTIAARLPERDRAVLLKEAERLARSIEVLRKKP